MEGITNPVAAIATMNKTDHDWDDIERLLRDLKADGYDVNALGTSHSEPVESKTIMIQVKR